MYILLAATPVRPIIIMWRRSTLFSGDLLFCRVVKISSLSVIYLWINVLGFVCVFWGGGGGYCGYGKKLLLKRCHCEIINDALRVLQSNIVWRRFNNNIIIIRTEKRDIILLCVIVKHVLSTFFPQVDLLRNSLVYGAGFLLSSLVSNR